MSAHPALQISGMDRHVSTDTADPDHWISEMKGLPVLAVGGL
jgi:hypothetical protein